MRNRIFVSQAADRSEMVQILTRNGYTVREGKEKNGSKVAWFVEYWREAA